MPTRAESLDSILIFPVLPRAAHGIFDQAGWLLGIWLLGICFRARRAGDGQNGDGRRGVRGWTGILLGKVPDSSGAR